jgi:hypothetical protein
MTMAQNDLIRLIRDSGEDRLLRIDRGEDQSAARVRGMLDNAYIAYSEKFPNLQPGEPEFNDEALHAEAVANPHRVRALLQAIGSSSSMMVALVWRIVQGDTIVRIDMKYRYEKEFQLRVAIENNLADGTTEFTFDRIEDATFLRHLGILRMGNEPVFDGYYALNLAK